MVLIKGVFMEQVSTNASNDIFSKEKNQIFLSVYSLVDGYCGVVRDSVHTLWRKDFKSLEAAKKKTLTIFNQILLMEKYLFLSEKYYKAFRYYESIGDEKEAKVYLKKAFSYGDKYNNSKGLQIISEN